MLTIRGGSIPIAPQALAELTPIIPQGYYYPDFLGLELEYRYALYGEIYMHQPWVHAAINKRAEAVARLPINVWDIRGNTRELDTRSAYARLMADPCPYMDQFSFWSWIQRTLDIYGETYLSIQRDGNGSPLYLMPMHPDRVTVKRDPETGKYTYYFMAGSGVNTELVSFNEEDIVPFKLFNPNKLERGLSKMEALRSTIFAEDSSRNATSSMWRNAGRPNIVLETENRLGNAGRKRLKLAFDAAHSGSSNAGQTLVLEDGVTAKAMQVSAVDMQYIESRQLNREEVCFLAGTKVITDKGLVPIESVQIGDLALTHLGRFRPVTRVMERPYAGEIVRVGAKGLNEVAATPNHAFWVQKMVQPHGRPQYRDGAPEWVPLDQVCARVAAHRGYRDGAFQAFTMPHLDNEAPGLVDLAQWARPTSVITSATVAGGVNARAISVPRYLKADEQLGWLIGLFVADGSASDHQVIWYLGSHERDLADRLQGAITTVFGLGASITEKRSVLRVVVSSRPVVDFFSQFSHGGRHLKRLSAWCLQESAQFRTGLLGGLVDGDGNRSSTGYTRVKTTSESLAWQIRLLLWSDGRGSSLVKRPAGVYCIEGRTGRQREAWDVQWRTESANRYAVHGGDVEQFFVKSVEREPYDGMVYNISVAEDHSYVTEGGACHNCGVYDTAPPMIHILDRATFSNIAAQMRSFYRDTMAPVLEFIQSVMDKYVGSYWLRPNIMRFDVSEVIRGDWEMRMEAAHKALTTGVATPNEAREWVGLNRYDDEKADRLYANAAIQELGFPQEQIRLMGQVAGTTPDGTHVVAPQTTPVPSAQQTGQRPNPPHSVPTQSGRRPPQNPAGPSPGNSDPSSRPKHLRALKGAVGRGKDIEEFALYLAEKHPDELESILEAVHAAIAETDKT